MLQYMLQVCAIQTSHIISLGKGVHGQCAVQVAHIISTDESVVKASHVVKILIELSLLLRDT